MPTATRQMPMKHGQIGEIDDQTRTVTVKGKCFVTKEEYVLKSVPLDGLLDWMQGKTNIQVALPNIAAPDREFLISGTSPKGWDKMFSPFE